MSKEKLNDKELKEIVMLYHKASVDYLNNLFKESESSFLREIRFELKDKEWHKKS
jgi:hypothetical protein